MKKPLIILGGMGPQASVHLHQLINKGDGSFKAPDEFPLTLHASIPVPDFIASAEATDDAVAMINQVTSTLPMDAACAVGIACNTAHLLLDRLNLPQRTFVSMIDAVSDDIVSEGAKKVGLLASPFTLSSGLYDAALKSRGVEVVKPSDAQVQELNEIIHGVIGGDDPVSMRPQLSAIALSLRQRGADSILLGCTELPLVGVTIDGLVIDSLSSLARHLLKRV